MKLVYVAGLEHSGTTLTEHLLSQHPQVIGLGEIASFFSPGHMERYMARWGEYPDVRSCSCGRTWEECDFWGDLFGLSGLNSSAPLLEKYRELLDHVRSVYGRNVAVVDSSKSLPVLKELVEGGVELGLARDEFLVVHTIKDVRSFAASVKRKAEREPSLLSHLRTFNWWLGSNEDMRRYLLEGDVRFVVNLYETLCADPRQVVERLLGACGLTPSGEVDVSHGGSHIAMGNKAFTERNRNRIVYDSAWFTDDRVNLAYLLHGKARRFNRKLYEADVS